MVNLLAGMLSFGPETPASVVDLGTFLLLTHPEQRALLADRPELWPSAVDEILRLFTTPIIELRGGLTRVADEELNVAGTTVRAGDRVLLNVAAANRDPAMFDVPEVFDITRDVWSHLSFGHGFYQCNFRRIARGQVEIGVRSVVDRFPTLRVAVDESEISRHAGAFVELPVTW